MSETAHARSRRAALLGLLLEVLTTLATFALAFYCQSVALRELGWFLAAGIPIWFVSLLVFRQHELAALEEMDLAELRRERKATGGGEALFAEQEAGSLGLLVARSRLEWMQKFLVPAFGLLHVVLLAGLAIWQWILLRKYARGDLAWPQLAHTEFALILGALVMLFLFFYARYAAGLGRVPKWQLLRAVGSYMFGGALLTLAALVALGAHLYQGIESWEHVVAWVIPVVMIVLAVETLINFILDLYRPRTPGVEPRACFDSRLIGLISEPGGIAHSLAEAINYQFGFQVSQTWFYQLLQRAFLPLVWVAVVTIWLLTCVVVVQPYERAIVERFGRQLNAERPLEPGIHFKWPAPFETVRRYNTGKLQEFFIGYEVGDQPAQEEEEEHKVELWTDEMHGGRRHFNFLIAPTPIELVRQQAVGPAVHEEQVRGERAPAHLIRMLVLVQYKLRPDALAGYTGRNRDPEATLRDIAWHEVTRFAAGRHADELIDMAGGEAGRILRDRIAARAESLGLGLDVVHVGLLSAHPEKTVAQAFRDVIKAQQERIAEIRKARVKENETLSEVAGDKDRALRLAHAIRHVGDFEVRLNRLERSLRAAAGLPADGQRWLEPFKDLWSLYRKQLEARWNLDQAQAARDRLHEDFELNAGGTVRDLQAADQRVAEGQAALEQATARLEQALAPVRAALSDRYGPQVAGRLLEYAETHAALEFWNQILEQQLRGLEGKAAVVLAEAQARRWQTEMKAAAEVTRLTQERDAYNVAPEIYRARSYLQTLVEGLKDARKYFLAFDKTGRDIKLRIEAQEQAQPDITQMSLEEPQP